MKDKNPQAFPDPMRGAEQSIINQNPNEESNGMELRDYFAAKAISLSPCNYHDIEAVAEYAYLLADAMLKERVKQSKKS